MKKVVLIFFLQTIASIYGVTSVSAQTGLNVHIGENGIDIQPDTFMSYYQAPADHTVWLRRENIPEEQWPLLFEIARAGNVTPIRVWEIRRQQPSWYDVLNVLNVPPSYFYYEVPAKHQLPPPYGHAYGYYREHPAEIVRWSDEDLFRLASVKYLSDSTHKPAHEAVVIYRNHPHFIHSHNNVTVKQKPTQMHNKAAKQKQAKRQGKQKNDKSSDHHKHGHKNK